MTQQLSLVKVAIKFYCSVTETITEENRTEAGGGTTLLRHGIASFLGLYPTIMKIWSKGLIHTKV